MIWIVVTISTLVTVTASAVWPEAIATNKFLVELVSHEIVSILVVILTVTMASVANVHLALGRIRARLLERGVDVSSLVADARRELAENAWYIFASFCILLAILIIKGFSNNVYWVSAAHSAAIVIFIFNLAVLVDIYYSVYMLASLDDEVYTEEEKPDMRQDKSTK